MLTNQSQYMDFCGNRQHPDQAFVNHIEKAGKYAGRQAQHDGCPMSDTGSMTRRPAAADISVDMERIRRFFLWLFVFSGWLVVIEPAPYELLFVITLALYLSGGLVATVFTTPLIVFALLYNLGGFLSTMEVSAQASRAFTFIIVSTYMAVTAIFYAMAVTKDPMRVIAVIRNAWTLAAVIAAINGMIGYFDIAGMGAAWAPIHRAQGTFKDPNVLSTFLVAPAIFLIQGFMLGNHKRPFLSGLALLIILGGIFLAFSRGAWAVTAGSIVIMAGMTFLVTPSAALRARIILFTIAGVLATAALVAFLLSFASIRGMFAERFALLQPYDAGETGRFANQMHSLPLLLIRPNGLGPFGFAGIYGEDPHNVYINAFASYGWLGGISYILLIISSLLAGLRACLTRTPWRDHAIAFHAPLVMLILQGLQIDTDHWRHFYILTGVTWGLFAASEMYRLRGGRWP